MFKKNIIYFYTVRISISPVSVALLVASRYALPCYGDRRVWVRVPGLAGSLCQVTAAYALRLKFRAGTEGSTVSSLICDRWTTDNRWPPAVCADRSSLTLFTRAAKLDPGAHSARCAWAMAVHRAVGISRQRNSGYRLSTEQGKYHGTGSLKLPIPPLAIYSSL